MNLWEWQRQSRLSSQPLGVYKDAGAGGLHFGIVPGAFDAGASRMLFRGAKGQPLADDAVNYISLIGMGEVLVSTVGWPAGGMDFLPLAIISTGSQSVAGVSGEFTPLDIIDYRFADDQVLAGTAPGGGGGSGGPYIPVSAFNQIGGPPRLSDGGDGVPTLAGTIVVREDAAANLASMVLRSSEFSRATDTGQVSIGDGVTAFADLPWLSSDVRRYTTRPDAWNFNDLSRSVISSADDMVRVIDWPYDAGANAFNALPIGPPRRIGQRLTISVSRLAAVNMPTNVNIVSVMSGTTIYRPISDISGTGVSGSGSGLRLANPTTEPVPGFLSACGALARFIAIPNLVGTASAPNPYWVVESTLGFTYMGGTP